MGGGLDGAKADSRIGHVCVDDCVDADPVELGALADEGDASEGADGGFSAVCANDVFGLRGDSDSIFIGYLGGDPVLVDGVVKNKALQRPTCIDLSAASLKCRTEDVFRVLLPNVEAVVVIRVRHPAHHFPATVVHSLAVFVGDASAPDEADLQHFVQQV